MRLLAFLFLMVSAVSASAQGTPTNLTATAIANSQVRLNWTAPTTTPVPDGYFVYRALATGGTPENITTNGQVVGVTFTDTSASLVPGTAYTYTVRAYIGLAGSETLSSPSNAVTVTPVASPDAPLNLRSTAVTSTSISLAWGAVSNATSYTIIRDDEEIDEVTGTTFTDTGLELSTTYSYVVYATTSTGESSDDSNTLTVTTFGDGSGKEAVFARRFRQIDINADGLLSEQEYTAGHGARLAWVVVKHRFDYSDTDSSGTITLSEYAKSLGGRKFSAPTKPRQFYLADLDESGELEIEEYPLILSSKTKQAKIERSFFKKDKDESDGLSPSELKIRNYVAPEPLPDDEEDEEDF